MSEILAPVGSIEALYAAIDAKADAVYFGLERFNARIKAENFTKENVKEYIDLCHLFGVKAYITFNTLVYDDEFKGLYEEVKACADANADAFIIADLGGIEVFKEFNVPLHASTQMGIHNLVGAKYLEDLGFTRVVLSREALISDIIQIKQNTNLEIEYFVHGALCVSFSGGCYLSSLRDNSSGNRGLCKQACRYGYKTSQIGAEKHLLSTSDQCFISKLKELKAAGVDSFKIEGRLKKAYYVGEVVKAYRLALENRDSEIEMSNLYRTFNRGHFTKGYNYEDTKDIMSVDVQGNVGERIGKVIKVKGKTLYIKSSHKINLKDGFKLFKDGVELGGFLVDNVKEEKGIYLINTLKSYPVFSEVHLTLDNSLMTKYENIKLTMPIEAYAYIENTTGVIGYKKDEIVAEYKLENLEDANKNPVTVEDLKDKLSKIGNTNFYVSKFEGSVIGNKFLPLSKINEIKRILVEELKLKILESYEANQQRKNLTLKNTAIKDNYLEFNRVITQIDDVNKITKSMVDNSDIVLEILDFTDKNILSVIKNALINNNLDKISLKLPKICRKTDFKVIDDFLASSANLIKFLVIENIYGSYFAKKYNLKCFAFNGLNITNRNALKYLDVDSFMYSCELNSTRISRMPKGYIFAYGEFECMLLTHCPMKLNYGSTCNNCKYKGPIEYYNGREKYTIKRQKVSNCYFSMKYYREFNFLSSLSKIKDRGLYLNFANKTKNEIDDVLECVIKGKNADVSNNQYLGHFLDNN